MLGKKTLILVTILVCISGLQFCLVAQRSTAKATIQPVEIVIGQQSVINLEVIAPKGRDIKFPVFNDSLVTGVEVLLMPKADTAYAHDIMTITQKYVITSFDSALYHIPHMIVLDGNDTIESNGFGLKVISPDLKENTASYLQQLNEQPTDSIDLDKLGIFDIKDIQSPPFVWQDYIIYGIALLLAILIIAAIIVGIYMYKKKKKKGYIFKPVVIQLPHVVALNALNQVKEEKLWQQGREKEYYTELTDILRKYIENRFYINAFEKTSDEILNMVQTYTETDSSYESLKQILKLSDLVKFAKYRPLPDENDLSLVNSFLFVNQTKKEEVISVPVKNDVQEDSKTDETEEEDEESIDWTITNDDDNNDPVNTKR